MHFLILWLLFVGFFGGSFGGRRVGRGIVPFCSIIFFFLCTNFTYNKILTLSLILKMCRLW